ncbi:MAG: DUF5134 domain-containing protein [Umezawaea sp.]
MIGHLGLRWALTLVLTCVAALHVHRLGTRSSTSARIGEGAHGAMCAAMIVMAWPWGAAIPLWPQVALFGSGAAWFTALGLRPLARGDSGRTAAGPLFHAAGMATMVWMLVAMRTAGTTHSHDGDLGVGWVALGLGLLSIAAAYWWFGESVRIVRASNSWQRGRCAVAHTAMGTATAVMVFAML